MEFYGANQLLHDAINGAKDQEKQSRINRYNAAYNHLPHDIRNTWKILWCWGCDTGSFRFSTNGANLQAVGTCNFPTGFLDCWNKYVAQQVGATSRSTPKNSAGIRQRGALAKNKNKNAPESKSNDYSKDIKALKKPPSTNYPRAPLPSDGTNRSVPKGMGNPNRPIPLQLLVSVTYVTLFSESSFASWLSKVCVLLHGERLAPLILHLIYSSKVNTAWLTRAIKADI